MGMNEIYRWYAQDRGIAGITIAATFDDAVFETITYLQSHFDDITGKTEYIVAGYSDGTKEPNMWVWAATDDDDFDSSLPNCLATNY